MPKQVTDDSLRPTSSMLRAPSSWTSGPNGAAHKQIAPILEETSTEMSGKVTVAKSISTTTPRRHPSMACAASQP